MTRVLQTELSLVALLPARDLGVLPAPVEVDAAGDAGRPCSPPAAPPAATAPPSQFQARF
ncbi:MULTISPECIES: hypothetical protein [unclassified Streptomyces]|uniref:hypothetical protein n=1 Tax=unclassified Streptomyces TaxID=2593676 RepID=UPI001655BB4F|nr:hypothetical protein [Streptomyces sp. CB02980]MCB8901185.1 hypothetical protein [Streptomyces sp. CB02980]